jgi:hypothetical protein
MNCASLHAFGAAAFVVHRNHAALARRFALNVPGYALRTRSVVISKRAAEHARVLQPAMNVKAVHRVDQPLSSATHALAEEHTNCSTK